MGKKGLGWGFLLYGKKMLCTSIFWNILLSASLQGCLKSFGFILKEECGIVCGGEPSAAKPSPSTLQPASPAPNPGSVSRASLCLSALTQRHPQCLSGLLCEVQFNRAQQCLRQKYLLPSTLSQLFPQVEESVLPTIYPAEPCYGCQAADTYTSWLMVLCCSLALR